MKTLRMMALLVVPLAALLTSGCAALTKTGLGTSSGLFGTGVGNGSINAQERAALNAARPGLGDLASSLLGGGGKATEGQQVPAGYAIVYDHYLDGVKVDPARIVSSPRLVATNGAAVIVVPTPPQPAVTNAPVVVTDGDQDQGTAGELDPAIEEALRLQGSND
jgi:hypothetical protein